MGECGCTMNDNKYTLPGPGKSFYLVSLSGGCVDCDAPPGVTIELIKPGDPLYAEYKSGEYVDGPMTLSNWGDSKGVAIITGHRRHEFVKETLSHLNGLEVKHFVDHGRIGKTGAETILEEMYEDSRVKPSIVVPVSK